MDVSCPSDDSGPSGLRFCRRAQATRNTVSDRSHAATRHGSEHHLDPPPDPHPQGLAARVCGGLPVTRTSMCRALPRQSWLILHTLANLQSTPRAIVQRLRRCVCRSVFGLVPCGRWVRTARFRVRVSPWQKFSTFPVRLSKIDQRNLKERWRGSGKMGNMGLEKMRRLSKIVPFFSNFSPISYQFHTFFVHFPKSSFW